MERDRDYYRHRAEQELRLARQAPSPEVGRIHYELAGHYLDRVHGDSISPRLRLVAAVPA